MRPPKVSRRMTRKLVATKKRVNRQNTFDGDPARLQCDGGLVDDDDRINPRKEKWPLGRRLAQVANFFEWDSWSEFSRMCGLPRNHVRTIATNGGCSTWTLVAIRACTRVNLNWLVAGGEDEEMGCRKPAIPQPKHKRPKLTAHPEAIAKRTRRKDAHETRPREKGIDKK